MHTWWYLDLISIFEKIVAIFNWSNKYDILESGYLWMVDLLSYFDASYNCLQIIIHKFKYPHNNYTQNSNIIHLRSKYLQYNIFLIIIGNLLILHTSPTLTHKFYRASKWLLEICIKSTSTLLVHSFVILHQDQNNIISWKNILQQDSFFL